MEDAHALAAGFQTPGTVTIALEDGGSFEVQKGLLCNASEYFRKALESGFSETHSKTLTLPGCSTSTFEFLLYWLVKGRVPSVNRITQDADLECNLARLWIFADMVMLPELQNCTVDALDAAIGTDACPPHVKTVRMIYAGTSFGSALRRYITEKTAFAWHAKKSCDSGEKNELGTIPGFFEAFADVTRSPRPSVFSNGSGKGLTPNRLLLENFYVDETTPEERASFEIGGGGSDDATVL